MSQKLFLQRRRKLDSVLFAKEVIKVMAKEGTPMTFENILAVVKNERMAARVMSVHLGHNTLDNVCFSD